MKPKPESYYYPIVRKYLHEKLKCVTSSQNSKGKEMIFERRGFGRLVADVYGLRGTDEINSRAIEGIAVEVKRATKRTSLRHIQQASQYFRIAHRCYLAQPREFDRATIEEASRMGVGLLQIRGNKIVQITDSQFKSPDQEVFLAFLRRSLNIFRCNLCGCYRFRYKNLASKEGLRTGGHWRKDQIAELLSKNRGNKKVYFCEKCEDLLNRKR
jgi:hypothetical protein